MSASAAPAALRIGMIGGGTVGGGVYELIMGRLLRERVTTGARPLLITKICVNDLSKPRSFHLDDRTTMTTNVDSIINDPDIDMVVEVMGGTGLAKTVVETAIQNKKHVVTANKALLAEHLERIQSLVADNQVGFGYEAAVCGGIPIIQTLQSSYTGDVIHQIQGICNGTTNYMLGKMEQGADYDAVLKEAQGLGYAEADPTADVEGHDVRAKICLLAKLAFGVTIPMTDVPCKGISQLTSVDFEYAKLLGCTIKLLGTAQRLHEAREWDGPLCVFVSPVMVPQSHVLAQVPAAGNAVAVTSANMGTCSYLGPGAGRFPTANSVVADICRLAELSSSQPPPLPFPTSSNNALALDHDYTSVFYIRIPFQDGLGIIKRVGELAELAGVSIHSILQTPIRDRMAADFCVTTEDCKLSQVTALIDSINQQPDFCRSPPGCVFMPLLVVDDP
jgi:homoserine dehydrogenase